ncbi:hypothetical protein A2U01_0082006, partial [Trifolium medium]|nr:hypothetical protein [Trifolium medium]
SIYKILEKQGSPLEPVAELPDYAVVEPVVVAHPSAAARPASSLCVAFRPTPVVLDTGDALFAVVATSSAAAATFEPTCYLQGPSQ